MNESLKLEAWERLISGRTLDGLPLGTKDGRTDLSGLNLPEPVATGEQTFGRYVVKEISPPAVFRHVKWESLDFTGSRLKSVRIFDSAIRNCLFDDCQMQDLRIWSSVIADSSLRGAKLRGAALGGVDNGKRNRFAGVDFSRADMRETAYMSASFERCNFRNTRLEKTNFQGTNFIDCQFEGEVRDVLFNRFAFQGEEFPPNEMVNVDFRKASLRFVDFRGLALDRVQFPKNNEHFVIRNCAVAFDNALLFLRRQEDPAAKKLVFFLENYRKWMVPNQAQGVINAKDLFEVAGEDGVNLFLAALSA
jgi:uncharacterized protein YjbI with pentapeptide repeats